MRYLLIFLLAGCSPMLITSSIDYTNHDLTTLAYGGKCSHPELSYIFINGTNVTEECLEAIK